MSSKTDELKKYPQAIWCPGCGRLLHGVAVDMGRLSRYWELNWDRAGFYYVANRTHSPYLCQLKRK
jgi:hypothetical protein